MAMLRIGRFINNYLGAWKGESVGAQRRYM